MPTVLLILTSETEGQSGGALQKHKTMHALMDLNGAYYGLSLYIQQFPPLNFMVLKRMADTRQLV